MRNYTREIEDIEALFEVCFNYTIFIIRYTMFGFEKFKKSQAPVERKPLTGAEFKEGNLPGTDTYDDGLNEKGELVMPGSTSTRSGGIYMEDTGPNDLRHRAEDAHAVDAELTIKAGEVIDEPFDDENDEAGKWLRENDPTLKK